jgi:hypothetical protein
MKGILHSTRHMEQVMAPKAGYMEPRDLHKPSIGLGHQEPGERRKEGRRKGRRKGRQEGRGREGGKEERRKRGRKD